MKYYLLIFTEVFILSSFLISLIMEILNSIRSLGALSALILAGFLQRGILLIKKNASLLIMKEYNSSGARLPVLLSS